MKDLVEDLFEFTKVQQHGAPVNLTTVDLSQLLEQVEATFELEADQRGIALTTVTTPHPLTLVADPAQLGRVFTNLVANALKYGEGATYIRLAAKRVGDRVVVTVENDGAPIPRAAVGHLFDRFYRVESSRSKETGGTGLGLAIVKSIVALHHGTVTVKSDQAQTVFTVTLPLAPPDQEGASLPGDRQEKSDMLN